MYFWVSGLGGRGGGVGGEVGGGVGGKVRLELTEATFSWQEVARNLRKKENYMLMGKFLRFAKQTVFIKKKRVLR